MTEAEREATRARIAAAIASFMKKRREGRDRDRSSPKIEHKRKGPK